MYMILGYDRFGRMYELQGMHTHENAVGMVQRFTERFQARGQFICLFITPVLDV